jgi:transposase
MALADSAGLPLAVSIAEGSRHDVGLVDQTLDEAATDTLPPNLIADRAFDSYPLAERLREERNIQLIAPKRSNSVRRRQDGRRLRRYRRRWKVERLFAWLKQFRRLATRWEHKADNFLAFLHLGCIAILLRRL